MNTMAGFSLNNIHTYVIGHYKPFSKACDLASYTTGRDLQLKVDAEQPIFNNLINSQTICQKTAERKSK